jgi:HAMP domain-containing protein
VVSLLRVYGVQRNEWRDCRRCVACSFERRRRQFDWPSSASDVATEISADDLDTEMLSASQTEVEELAKLLENLA